MVKIKLLCKLAFTQIIIRGFKYLNVVDSESLYENIFDQSDSHKNFDHIYEMRIFCKKYSNR